MRRNRSHEKAPSHRRRATTCHLYSLPLTRRSFFRRWTAPASHTWQNSQEPPLKQPEGFLFHAQGLHLPSTCNTEPCDGGVPADVGAADVEQSPPSASSTSAVEQADFARGIGVRTERLVKVTTWTATAVPTEPMETRICACPKLALLIESEAHLRRAGLGSGAS